MMRAPALRFLGLDLEVHLLYKFQVSKREVYTFTSQTSGLRGSSQPLFDSEPLLSERGAAEKLAVWCNGAVRCNVLVTAKALS